jgi:hypothetical protein
MNIAKFNELLEKYSINLLRLKAMRLEINCCSAEAIFLYLTKIDISGNGYLSK